MQMSCLQVLVLLADADPCWSFAICYARQKEARPAKLFANLYFLKSCYLLKLLTHLTQRDLIDFGSTEEESGAAAANGAGQAVDVAQLVFLGLDILIPLISLELLGYPKLCLLYFQLLAYMMEVSTTIAHLHAQPTNVVSISGYLSIATRAAFQRCCCVV